MFSTYSSTPRKPVFQPLLLELRRQLADGTIQPGEMLGTELHLARRARISRNSVRAAIDQLVEEGLVERRPGKGLFARKGATSCVIELVLPALAGIWVDVARGAQMCGREAGAKVQIFNAQLDFESDLDMIRRLGRGGVDGAIIGSWHQPALSQAVVELHRSGFPLVFVDQRLEDMDIPSVVPDNRAIGLTAGRQLLRRGHRRIGFIGYLSASSGRERLEGFRDAINDAGLPFDRSLVMDLPLVDLTTPSGSHSLDECVRRLLDRPDRPTAILLHAEELAGRVYQNIRAMNLRVPSDVSVVGVGTGVFAAFLDPPLTSVDVRGLEIGRAAMEILLKRLAGNQVAAEHRIISAQWVERASIVEAPTRNSDAPH